jgi:hypothetical protein
VASAGPEGHDAEFGKVTANRDDYRGLLANQQMTRAMNPSSRSAARASSLARTDRIMGALAGPTSMALTCRAEEPSTTSLPDSCRNVKASVLTVQLELRKLEHALGRRVPAFRQNFRRLRLQEFG